MTISTGRAISIVFIKQCFANFCSDASAGIAANASAGCCMSNGRDNRSEWRDAWLAAPIKMVFWRSRHSLRQNTMPKRLPADLQERIEALVVEHPDGISTDQ